MLNFDFYGKRFSFDVEVKVKHESKRLRLTFDLAILPGVKTNQNKGIVDVNVECTSQNIRVFLSKISGG